MILGSLRLGLEENVRVLTDTAATVGPALGWTLAA
jgi:hypothetical protein